MATSFPSIPPRWSPRILLPNSTSGRVKVLAIDEVNEPPQVNLGNGALASPPANTSALTFNAGAGWDGTGLDGSGDTYSLNALVSAIGSATLVPWNSEDFNLGAMYIDDAISGTGQTIPLPQGSFTSLQLLGTGVNGVQASVTFTVNYVGGGTTTFTQSFSDWKTGYTGAGTTAPGESIAVHMTSYNTSAGNTSGNAYLYGYVISTNSAKIVSSIQFPSNANVVILAIDEINASQQLDPEDGVIEGEAAVVSGAQPVRAPVAPVAPVGRQPLATAPRAFGLSSLGGDAVSAALDEMQAVEPTALALGDFSAASGPLWAGQLGNEAVGSAAAGPFSASLVLPSRPKGRLSWWA